MLSEDEEDSFFDASAILAKYRRYYRLFPRLLGVFALLALIFVMLAGPMGAVKYSATAMVGPAASDSGANLVGALNAQSGLTSLLAGGKKGLISSALSGMNGGNDTFGEYTTLLTSTRLAYDLATKKNILPVIFYKRWDSDHNQWLPRDDPFHMTVDFVKGLLNLPVKPHPDVDDLNDFFDKNLDVQLPYTSTYATVTFTFKDPGQAERILALILQDADDIVRKEEKRDVSARIKYLETALQQSTVSEERDALISMLATQRQAMVLIEADHRYASMFLDPPHAPLLPTSPSLPFVGVLVVLLTLASGTAMIFLLKEDHWILVRYGEGAWKLVPKLWRWGRRLIPFGTRRFDIKAAQNVPK